MGEDLPHWIGHYAGMLGCESYPAAVAVATENLLSERDRQRKTIGRLRGANAASLGEATLGRAGGVAVGVSAPAPLIVRRAFKELAQSQQQSGV